MTEREAFEAWHAENKNNDWLWRVNKVDAYHVWQASRRAALEECANLCDGNYADWDGHGYARRIGALAESDRSEGM